MGFLNRLGRRLLYGPPCVLRDYERACLDRLSAALPAPEAALLDAQLRCSVNRQRQMKDKLLCIVFPAEPGVMPRFANVAEDLCVAAVTLRPVDGGHAVRCRMMASDGWLCGLEFDRPPKAALASGFEVEAFDLTADLTHEETPLPAPASTPLLDRVRAVAEVSEVAAPLPGAPRERALASLGVPVPPDYAALLAETDGFRAGGWRFLGAHPFTVPWPDVTYYVLADLDPLNLCLVAGEPTPRLVLLDQIDEEAHELGAELIPALITLLTNPPHTES